MPDAPPPTFDNHGNLVAEWSLSCRYTSAQDLIVVTWAQEAGPYHTAKNKSETYSPQDVEDVVAIAQRAIRILAARRLF